MQKRPDLQGIRGIAILSVLLYHFFPDTFKNGYVGVDQFFILSGFLMAEILSRESTITYSGVFAFYYRRMRRILPLYVIFILLTLLLSIFVFSFPFFTYNIPYALRSLAFISNTKTEDEATYEELLANAQVLFTHTWSLSCEVQFYIIAPFLLVSPHPSCNGMFLAVISFISYTAFTYMFETGWQELAFNLMPTRIWQFVIGSLCSTTTDKNESTEECEKLIKKDIETEPGDQSEISSANVTLFSLLLLCLFPIGITPHFVRLVVCLQTAGLISAGKTLPNKFLSNRYLAYLGDISYSLYLIHWPVRVLMKQYQYISTIATLLGMLLCILLAMLVYETYEKYYLRLDKPGIVTLTSILYLSCILLILTQSPETFFSKTENIHGNDVLWQVPDNLTIDATIGLNEDFNIWDATPDKACIPTTPQNRRVSVTCTYNNTNFSGKKRILLIGNSYAENLGRLFPHVKECQAKAKEIQLFSLNGCEVLENTGEWASRCANKTEDFQLFVAKYQPDVLFISTRQMTPMMLVKGAVDTILETEISLLKRLEQNVKEKVYIFNAIPRQILAALTDRINKGLQSGKPVSQDLLWDKSHDYMLARKRMALLAK